jgi:integrative and conjugative element protein (TIGR02256 family)
LKFKRPGGGVLAFGAAPWKTMLGFRQLTPTDLEAGGILLGRLIIDSQDVIVDSITVPGIRDRRERLRFWRGKSSTQKLVDRAWAESGGTRVYLGEWHSHPEDDPSPSSLDASEQVRVVRTATFEHGFLFFVIVGRQWVRVWEQTSSGSLGACRSVERQPP